MSVLTSLGILISAMLIMAFLQFIPGVFALTCHHNYGKFSKIKASDLSTFFILGVETTFILFSVIIYIFISSLSPLFFSFKYLSWLAAAISAMLGIIFFFCYYRKGDGTKLFVPRSLVAKLHNRINFTKSRSDAFLLGIVSVLPELLFSAPLLVFSMGQIETFSSTPVTRAFLIILFALFAILPLIIMHIFSNTGHTLADFIRFRFKNKSFFRLVITILYFIIAFLFIMGASA